MLLELVCQKISRLIKLSNLQGGNLWLLLFYCQSFWGRKEGPTQPEKWHPPSLVIPIRLLTAWVTSEQCRHKRVLWVVIAWIPLLWCYISIWYSLAKHGSLLTEDDVPLLGHKALETAMGALSASGSDDLGPCLIHASSRTLACLILAPHKPTELLCSFLPLVALSSWSHPCIAWPGTRVTSFQILNALGCLKRKQEGLLCLLAHVPSLLWAYTSSL